jgi:hypothetical protein
MMVCQPTPYSTATAATSWPSSPTRRHDSARARSVSDARDPRCSLAWNDNSKPFVWAKTAEQILERLGRLIQRINGAGH